MTPRSTKDLKKWAKTLPRSEMVFPSSFHNRLKYVFWRGFTPVHPYLKNTLRLVGINLVARQFQDERGRQDFLIGKVAPGQTIEEVVWFLIENGYGNHFIAWKDAGEVVSLRYLEGFDYQYHIRIFADGEVRGHYEYTPEAYPVSHIRQKNFQDRRDEFLDLLGDRIIIV